jgi:nicotinamidase-related amidase
MSNALVIVDVQNGFINRYSDHIPSRVVTLVEKGDHDPILFTRFINSPDGPYPRLMDWHDCAEPPETDLVDELQPLARDDNTFDKHGFAGIPDSLVARLTDQGIERATVVGIDTDMCVLKVAMDIFDLNIEPIVLVDCCASTSGLQSHLAGLAVLARNIGADQLRDAGLGQGRLAAPIRMRESE